MSTSESPGQSTIADVLAELRLQRVEISGVRSEISGVRTELSGLRAEVSLRLSSLEHLTSTLIDEVAAFRAEYNGHTHGE